MTTTYQRGLARYQFEFREKWHPEITAGDLRTMVVFNTKAQDYEHATEIRPFLDMIRGNIDTKDNFIAAVDAEVQDIRADKQREARFMKEQIERRRELCKNRDKIMLNMVKALEDQGVTEAQVVQTIATMQAISQNEAQKYYDQLVVAS